MLMWVFLASDCMFFGSLIATYLIYRGRAEDDGRSGRGSGPLPARNARHSLHLGQRLRAPDELADDGAGAGRRAEGQSPRPPRLARRRPRCWASIFLGGQYFEFTEFYHEGLGLTTNMFGTTFFTLTGFHGAHVTIGVIRLLSLLFVSLRGGVKQEDALDLEIVGLYWHFVDIVWIVIFTLVYLIPYEDDGHSEGGEHAMRLIGLGQSTLRCGFSSPTSSVAAVTSEATAWADREWSIGMAYVQPTCRGSHAR